MNANRRKRYSEDAEGREKRLAANRQWKRDNPEKVRANNRNRKSKFKTLGTFTNEELDIIREEQGNKCPGCFRVFSEELPESIDHFVPISKGGSNYASNIQLLCLFCNCSKNDKLWKEWKDF